MLRTSKLGMVGISSRSLSLFALRPVLMDQISLLVLGSGQQSGWRRTIHSSKDVKGDQASSAAFLKNASSSSSSSSNKPSVSTNVEHKRNVEPKKPTNNNLRTKEIKDSVRDSSPIRRPRRIISWPGNSSAINKNRALTNQIISHLDKDNELQVTNNKERNDRKTFTFDKNHNSNDSNDVINNIIKSTNVYNNNTNNNNNTNIFIPSYNENHNDELFFPEDEALLNSRQTVVVDLNKNEEEAIQDKKYAMILSQLSIAISRKDLNSAKKFFTAIDQDVYFSEKFIQQQAVYILDQILNLAAINKDSFCERIMSRYNKYGYKHTPFTYFGMIMYFIKFSQINYIHKVLNEAKQNNIKIENILSYAHTLNGVDVELLTKYLEKLGIEETIPTPESTYDVEISSVIDDISDNDKTFDEVVNNFNKLDEKNIDSNMNVDLITNQNNTKDTNQNDDKKRVLNHPPASSSYQILENALSLDKDFHSHPLFLQQLLLEQRMVDASSDHIDERTKNLPMVALGNIPNILADRWKTAFIKTYESRVNKLKQDGLVDIKLYLSQLNVESLFYTGIKEVLQTTASTSTPLSKKALIRRIGFTLERISNIKILDNPRYRKFFHARVKLQAVYGNDKDYNMTLKKLMKELDKHSLRMLGGYTLEWPNTIKDATGKIILDTILDSCKVQTAVGSLNAFFFVASLNDRKQVIQTLNCHESISAYFRKTNTVVIDSLLMPMLVKPRPWYSWKDGAYLCQSNKVEMVRTGNDENICRYIERSDSKSYLNGVMKTLDALGSVSWRVNNSVLAVAIKCWNLSIPVKSLPPVSEDLTKIEPPKNMNENPGVAYAYRMNMRKAKQAMAENYSQRCDASYKLSVARSFCGRDIFFPHNIDFRGRAYPIPAHLNHMGNDLCRGLLKFSERKPLGERGFYWLKVQIATLADNGKVSFDDRVIFTENNWDNILDSVKNPIDGKQWWLQFEAPFQLLASCFEYVRAIESGNPITFKSGLPIHQDGTCNGLQHYAALGGDIEGAKSVNLSESKTPMDVYIAVANKVQELVKKDLEKGNEVAKLVSPRISRKLVKQTVMTNTYGVTFVGARLQVESRLKEQRAEAIMQARRKFEHDGKTFELSEHQKDIVDSSGNQILDSKDIYKCSLYTTKKIFEALSHLFQSAREIQIWLTKTAHMISSSVQESDVDPIYIADYKQLEKMGVIKADDIYISKELKHDIGTELGEDENDVKNEIEPSTSSDETPFDEATLYGETEAEIVNGMNMGDEDLSILKKLSNLQSELYINENENDSIINENTENNDNGNQIMNNQNNSEYEFNKNDKNDMTITNSVLNSINNGSEKTNKDIKPRSNADMERHMRSISTLNSAVVWTSPMGLPVVQPYYKKTERDKMVLGVRTKLEALQVDPRRQSTAFPPNFVHSLDATHMMLTALACTKHGLTYAAVHDSYWTHACDTDKLAQLLRSTFVRLHSENILDKLMYEFKERYKGHLIKREVIIPANKAEEYQKYLIANGRRHKKVNEKGEIKTIVYSPLNILALPKRGNFDINKVKESPYFFH